MNKKQHVNTIKQPQNNKVTLNEEQLKRVVMESVKKALCEISDITAWSAAYEAQNRLNQLAQANGGQLPNTPEVQKLQRQLKLFQSYGENDNEEQRRERFKQMLATLGVNATDQQINDYETIENNYGGKYDYNTQTQRQMANHKMIKDALDKDGTIYAKGNTIYDPKAQGFKYNKPGLFGRLMGKKPSWTFDKQQAPQNQQQAPQNQQQAPQNQQQRVQMSEQQLKRVVMESVKKSLREISKGSRKRNR